MKARRYSVSLAVVVLLGVAAVSARWLGRLRPLEPELRAQRTITVVSGADSGPGTLREALFATARSSERVRILLRAKRVILRTPLPPATVAGGVVIDAADSGCEIDGAAVPGGPLLDLTSARSSIVGLSIRNARDQGIIVRANSILLRGLKVSRSGDGIVIGNGVVQTRIEQSAFDSNVTGIRILYPPVQCVIQDNTFRNHDEAAIWSSAPAPIGGDAAARVIVQRNRFEGDRISIALMNVPGIIIGNEISRDRQYAMYLFGSRAIVRRNRIHGGGIGLMADGEQGSVIAQNEIDRTSQVGMLVRNSRNSLVVGNRVYSNAYGIASVFGEQANPDVFDDNLIMANGIDGIWIVGAAPLIRHNDVLNNGGAAARVLDFVPWDGPRIGAAPRMENNTFRDNKINEAVRGEYRPKREEVRQ